MRQHTKILNSCFLSLCCVLIIVNAFQLFQKLGPGRPVAFAGLKFSGLGEKLKEESTVGYVSDLDIKNPGPLAEYQQAQYILAPVLLDIQQPSRHRYVLINCSDDASAIQKLKELNARPLLRNQFGVIFAEINGARTVQPNQGGS
jgi:hypothetical protein